MLSCLADNRSLVSLHISGNPVPPARLAELRREAQAGRGEARERLPESHILSFMMLCCSRLGRGSPVASMDGSLCRMIVELADTQTPRTVLL
mmetsp:Transcript_6563/g.15135  ORF Transcript_6563/g.15135 Transcript_6563/m.15135 type:complete len:92 (+) Transcript_6563:3-278(+)